MDRRDEVSLNLAETNERIDQACRAAGRTRDDVTLIAVTKTWPASDTELLADLGVTDVGENRDQDARIKHDELIDLPITWHAIGQIQTNKAKSIATWADVVHGVDRVELVVALNKAAGQRDAPLPVLVQLNLDEQPVEGRGGCLPAGLAGLTDAVIASDNLSLVGIMGVAPLDGDRERAFASLQEASAQRWTAQQDK